MNIFSLLSLIAAIIYLELAIYVLKLNIKARLNQIFFLLKLACFIWAFGFTFIYSAPDKEAVWFWYKFAALGWTLVPGLLLHFSMLLIKKDRIFRYFLSYVFLYLPGIIFFYRALTDIVVTRDFVKTNFGWTEVSFPNSPWFTFFIFYYLLFAGLSIYFVYDWGRKSTDQKEKIRVRLIAYAALITIVLLTFTDVIFPGVYLPPVSQIIILIWAFANFYAIEKYKLMIITPEIATNEIISNIMDLIILINWEGKIIQVNPRVESTLGFSEKDLVNKYFWDIIFEKEIIIATFMRVKKEGQDTKRYDINFRTNDNQLIPVNASFSKIKNKKNEIIGFILSGYDFTQSYQLNEERNKRQEIEEQLKKEEEFLSLVFDSIQDGISILDDDFNIIRVNSVMEKWYAHSMPLIGKKCYEAYHCIEHPCEICPSHEAIQTLKKCCEIVPKRTTGGVINGWIELFSHPIIDKKDGQIKGVIEYVRDITDRKKFEDELKENETKYRELFSNLSDAVTLYELNRVGIPTKLIEINEAALQILKLSKDEAFTKTVPDLLAPEELKKLPGFIIDLLSKKRMQGEAIFMASDGTRVPVEISARLFIWKDKRVILSIGRDIRERKRIEEIKKERNEKIILYQKVLLELSKLHHYDLKSSLEKISELDAKTLNISRVGVWLFNSDYTEMYCETLFSFTEEKSFNNNNFLITDYRHYFTTIKKSHILIVEDIENNPATLELVEKYYQPLKIKSIMNIPIWFEGKIMGFLSHEHRGDVRIWTHEEQDFALSVSEIVSLALVSAERQKAEERLKYLSQYDSLTGLYNRAYYEKEINRLQNTSLKSMGIIVLDIDGLKIINDTLGHDKGDILLLGLAYILKEALHKHDVAARIGGDEFAILLPNTSKKKVSMICNKINNKIAKYNKYKPELPLSISIGYSISTKSGFNVIDIFKEADNNMYREKLHHRQSLRSAIVHTLMKALQERDFITEGHADRLQTIVEAIGLSIGLPDQKLTDLKLLAQFHDIGKVGITDRILFKPSTLSPEEFNEMKRHAEIGNRIALSSIDLAPIADWILKHHEWWNGKGYPLGLKGEEIPLESRILAIADAYDAMISDRPYRKAMPKNEAIKELEKNSGSQFDPKLVKIFTKLLKRIKVDK